MAKEIAVTKDYLIGLRTAYSNAVETKATEFTYRGSDFLTQFAKYFLENYEPQFGIKTKKK